MLSRALRVLLAFLLFAPHPAFGQTTVPLSSLLPTGPQASGAVPVGELAGALPSGTAALAWTAAAAPQGLPSVRAELVEARAAFDKLRPNGGSGGNASRARSISDAVSTGRVMFDRARALSSAPETRADDRGAVSRSASSPRTARKVEVAVPKAGYRPQSKAGFGAALRRTVLGAVAALALFVGGCLDSGSDSSTGPVPDLPAVSEVEPWTWYLTYSYTGHPLAAYPDGTPYLGYDGQLEDELAWFINDYRSSLGLAPLESDPDMADLDRAHAQHMDVHDFTGAWNPEGDGPNARRLRAGRFAWSYEQFAAWGWQAYDAYGAFWRLMEDWAFRSAVEDPFMRYVSAGHHSSSLSRHGHYWAASIFQ